MELVTDMSKYAKSSIRPNPLSLIFTFCYLSWTCFLILGTVFRRSKYYGTRRDCNGVSLSPPPFWIHHLFILVNSSRIFHTVNVARLVYFVIIMVPLFILEAEIFCTGLCYLICRMLFSHNFCHWMVIWPLILVLVTRILWLLFPGIHS